MSLEKFREAARFENPDVPSSTKPKLVTTLSLLAPETGDYTPVPDAGLGAVPCDWSADGSRLLVGRVDTSGQALQLYTWNRVNGAWTRVQRGPVGSGAGIANGPILLAWHGPVRIERGFSSGIWIKTNEKENQLLPESRGGQTPDVSPDGRTVVFSRADRGAAHGPSIYLEALDDAQPRFVTRGSHPRYSRNGEWIAFSRESAGNSDIWIMRADGSAKRQVTKTSYDEEFPSPSPDGRYVVYASSRGNENESLLYVTRVSDGVEREIVHSGLNSRPVW
jgi:dipeptidyl aminopeptidase/acylaminoacyl peptidase